MVIKLPIGDFELDIGVFRIRDLGFKSPILKTPIPNSKTPTVHFYHQLVISTLSSLL